ncbi:MAG: ABC transporter substrate-binding protein, partial [Chloroflexota bacterium]
MLDPRRHTRRFVAGGLGSMALGALAAACRPAAIDDGASKPTAEQVKLRFLSPAAHIEESVKQMTPMWEAEHPNVSVDWIHSDNFSRDVIAHSAADDMEDLVSGWMGGQEPQIWFLAGITIPLDPYVRTFRVNPKDWYKAVWESHFEDGKQFSLPWQGQVFGIGLMYNKRVFDEVGVKYPAETWTLDDFVVVAEQLRLVQGNEVQRWGVAPGEDGFVGERFPGYARNFNAEMFSADQKRITWGDGREFLQCLDWYTDVMQQRHGVMYSIGGARRAGLPDGGDPAIQGLKKYTEGLLGGKLAMVSRIWLGATGIMAAYVRDNPGVSYGMT